MNSLQKDLVDSFKGALIVSCQAYPGEALRRPEITAAMAQAVVAAGAKGVRVQGVADIAAARQAVEVPLIGLIKFGHEGVYITPSIQHARACALAGCDIVAIDATLRPRWGEQTFADAVEAIHDEFPHVLIMADCASVEDAKAAADSGADLIGTTLAGYTPGYEYAREATPGPDLEFITQVCEAVNAPVIVEGRIHTPQQLADVFTLPIHAACVGSAITHPGRIMQSFLPSLPTS